MNAKECKYFGDEVITADCIKIRGLSNVNKSNKIHFLIYKIINLVNGMYYIGQHETTNPMDSYMGSGVLITNAINKYGISNFVKEILFDFDDKDKMNSKEKEMVSEEICYHKNNQCYNLAVGGKGGNLGKEVGRRISNAIRGERNGMYGKKLTQETLEKISAKLKGHKNYNHGGYHHTEDAKRRIAEKHIGMRHSQETIEKLRDARRHQKNVNTNGIKGLHWYCDPKSKVEGCFEPNKEPKGWIRGRIYSTVKGQVYYTNGVIDILVHPSDKIPEGFHKGRKTKPIFTEERNKKISEKLKGRKLSEETRRKLSEATKRNFLRKQKSGFIKPQT